MTHRTDKPHEPGTMPECWECNPPAQPVEPPVTPVHPLNVGNHVEYGFGRLGIINAVIQPHSRMRELSYAILPIRTPADPEGGIYTTTYPHHMVKLADINKWRYNTETNSYSITNK